MANITPTAAQANAAAYVAYLREAWNAAEHYPWPEFTTTGPPVERVEVEDGWSPGALHWHVTWVDDRIVARDGCGSQVTLHRTIGESVKRAAAKLLLAEPTTTRYRVEWRDGQAVAEPIEEGRGA